MATVARPAEAFTVLPTVNEAGKPVFCVLVKRTYRIERGKVPERIEPAAPLRLIDEYYDDGDPESSTVQYESDLAAFKLATDVVVVGRAYTAAGKPATQMDVSVEIAGQRKTIRVYGDRVCRHRAGQLPSFTEPVPFESMEIRYDRAYGGWDRASDPPMPTYYPRNPAGRGYVLKNITAAVDGLPLPNLEDPQDLLTPQRLCLETPERWNRQPLPQGFGWYSKLAYPRASFVGSMPTFIDLDEPLREEGLGLVAKGHAALARQFKLPSYDVRFNRGASLGLSVPWLAGGEPIVLRGLDPEGSFGFPVPSDVPRIELDLGSGPQLLPSLLHTFCLRLDDHQADLVWRGALEYPGVAWLPEMKRLDVTIT